MASHPGANFVQARTIRRDGGDNRAGSGLPSIDGAGTLWHGCPMMLVPTIYKIVPAALWRAAERSGTFEGAPVDVADGFIHLSSASQVRETARRHFAGMNDLLLVAFDPEALGPALKWEPSRGGDLFPHLYGPLPTATALSVEPLPLGNDGAHVFPDAVS